MLDKYILDIFYLVYFTTKCWIAKVFTKLQLQLRDAIMWSILNEPYYRFLTIPVDTGGCLYLSGYRSTFQLILIKIIYNPFF